MADRTVCCFGPASADRSCLSVRARIAAAEGSESDGLHAGYGFLSESSSLAQAGAAGGILANQGNAVLIGGIGESYFAVAIARACIRDGARGRFFNVVDPVN